MKFNAKNLFLSVLIGTSTITPYAWAELPADPSLPELEGQSPVNPLDSMIDVIRQQLGQISLVLSSISQMIANKEVIPTNGKAQTLENIKQLNHLVQNIQKDRFVETDIHTIICLVEFNTLAMQHIIKAVEGGLKAFPHFNPSAAFTKKIPVDLSPAYLNRIQRQFDRNEVLSNKLIQAADNAGLHWYNKLYRVFDAFVIEPCYKYSIPQRALMATAATTAAMWAWWRMGHDSFKAALGGENSAAYKFWGPKMEATKDGNGHLQFPEYEKLGPVGKLDAFLFEIKHQISPIGTYAGAIAMAYGAKELTDHVGPKVKKELKKFHNHMMGGAYLKEAMKLSGVTEDVSFNDLVGLEHVKKEFRLLINYLENPESYDRLGVTPSKGVLLVGETRTGKSYSVKALFGEINRMLRRTEQEKKFTFIELPATLINEMGITYWMEKLKKAAPCIVFIDEIDLLGLQRQGKNETLSEFLTCMSGTVDAHDPKHQIIIIAATNRPENMDEALRQPGRFGKEIRFEYPSYQDRYTFIARKLEKLSLESTQFNVDRLARETENKSYEALNILINHAVLKARIAGEGIAQKHFEQTLDEELRHIISFDNKELPAYEKEIIAGHFAGRAIAVELLQTKQALSKVTIQKVMTNIKEEPAYLRHYSDKEQQKRFDYGALFTTHESDTSNVITHTEKLKQIQCHLAGFVAEELLFGTSTYSCHPAEHDYALALAKSITFQGFDIGKLPKKAVQQRSEQAIAILDECETKVRELLQSRINELVLVSHALQKEQTLTAEQIKAILGIDRELLELQELQAAQGTVPSENMPSEPL